MPTIVLNFQHDGVPKSGNPVFVAVLCPVTFRICHLPSYVTSLRVPVNMAECYYERVTRRYWRFVQAQTGDMVGAFRTRKNHANFDRAGGGDAVGGLRNFTYAVE